MFLIDQPPLKTEQLVKNTRLKSLVHIVEGWMSVCISAFYFFPEFKMLNAFMMFTVHKRLHDKLQKKNCKVLKFKVLSDSLNAA